MSARADYEALRALEPSLPELPAANDLRVTLDLADILLPEPLWTDENGFSDQWMAVRSELGNQRFQMKRERQKIDKPVRLDENAEGAVKRLIKYLPGGSIRDKASAFLSLRMPIDRWIQLSRVAEDLLAEVIAAREPPAPPPAAPPAAAAAPSADPAKAASARPSAPAAADTAKDHPAEQEEARQ
jgi:hypothetical protein